MQSISDIESESSDLHNEYPKEDLNEADKNNNQEYSMDDVTNTNKNNNQEKETLENDIFWESSSEENATSGDESTSNNKNKKRNSESNQTSRSCKKRKENDEETPDYCNTPENTEIAILPPVNNIIHQSYIQNVNSRNYHPHNNINTNSNMVALQIPLKYYSSVKPKLENAREMKNKLQKHNPHVKIEKASKMEAHLFNVWLWDALSLHVNVIISTTFASSLNIVMEFKGKSLVLVIQHLTFHCYIIFF